MTRAAKKRCFCHQIDVSVAGLQAKGFVDNDNDIRILGVTFSYAVASNTGTWEEIEVGTEADHDLYYGSDGENSKAIGYSKVQTLDSTALLPAGTALFIQRQSTDAANNTATIDVQVWYETVDKTPQP
jgi:hypothetical protein